MLWSRNTLWRQGSILAQKDFYSLELPSTPDITLAVAISHDCDIAHDNLEVEPDIEFIFARILEQHNGNYIYGKNPRILHLGYTHDAKEVFLELLASKKVTLQKIGLKAVQPDETYKLTHSRNQILQSWLAARYRRHALPNSLVERLRPVSSYIEKEGRKNSSGILSFRLFYEPIEPPNELPPEEAYELWLSIVYSSDDDKYRSMAEEIADKLKIEFPKLLEDTKNIGKVDLRQCKAFSEMEFTLQDMRGTFELHLEHLSHRTTPPGPVL